MDVFLGDTVFLGGAASTPIPLIQAMTEHGKNNQLRNVHVCHIHTEGKAEYTAPECAGMHNYSTLVCNHICLNQQKLYFLKVHRYSMNSLNEISANLSIVLSPIQLMRQYMITRSHSLSL